MNDDFLDADQKDALQEISNIAMGTAASVLAKVFESFVRLSVPRISVIETSRMTEQLAVMLPDRREVSAVRQAFYNQVEGEVVVVFGEEGCTELADLLDYDVDEADAVKQELLLDVSNILVGACMNGIAQQLGEGLSFSAPEILCTEVPLDRLFAGHRPSCEHALLIEIGFSLE
ncbi:MAG TPA: chemotaxis protein CheC, partial [Polyangiaceae bacterium]|nr:chemotaxis protein CheC [Polyangiaceae bacterium]